MINEQGILETPYNLATLSQATGNPILDLGYQCCDMRPYFEYKKDNVFYYTTVHPKNLTLSVINVYEKYVKNVDGIEYDAMKYVGTTTATSGTTITFNNIVYTYTENIVNVRGFYINKWAAYKPVKYGTQEPLTDEERFSVGINGGITPIFPSELVADKYYPGDWTDNEVNSVLSELQKGNTYWIYECPKEGDWFRMTDFENYYPDAIPPFSIDLASFSGLPEMDGVFYLTKGQIESHILSVRFQQQSVSEYNLDIFKMPGIFKPDEKGSYGIGAIYGDGTNAKVVPYLNDKDEFLYPLVWSEDTNEAGVTIDIDLGINETLKGRHIIGGFIQNNKSTDTLVLFPAKVLDVTFDVIPAWGKVTWEISHNGKDIILELYVSTFRSKYWDRFGDPDDCISGFGFARYTTQGIISADPLIIGYDDSQNVTTHPDDNRDYYINETDSEPDETYGWTGEYTGMNTDNIAWEIKPIYYLDTTVSKFVCVWEGIKDIMIDSGSTSGFTKDFRNGVELLIPTFTTRNNNSIETSNIHETTVDLKPLLIEWGWIETPTDD